VDELEGRISPEQRHFAAFQARVGKEPAQCLRYCFDAGATPLWPSSKNIPGRGEVTHLHSSACSACLLWGCGE
jgi:pre-rRNA-processing protein TSR4